MKKRDDYDSTWKHGVQMFFEQFLRFFFSDAHAQIDWRRGVTFLDKELRRIVRDAKLGDVHADVLARVYLKTGAERIIVIHIEVQSQKRGDFVARMFGYFLRGYELHKNIASFAILADSHKEWIPNSFHYEALGTKVAFEFSVAKLDSFRARWDELERSDNPFAVIVMAHLKTQDTRKDPDSRYNAKVGLARMIVRKKFPLDDMRKLLAVIDWMMLLSDNGEKRFKSELHKIEKEPHMELMSRYEMSIRREARKEGVIQTQRNAILETLRIKYGKFPAKMASRVKALSTQKQLSTVFKCVVQSESLADVKSALCL